MHIKQLLYLAVADAFNGIASDGFRIVRYKAELNHETSRVECTALLENGKWVEVTFDLTSEYCHVL